MITTSNDNSLTLLHRWRAGDHEAADELLHRHHLEVRNYFRLRLDDYEDLVKETFARLLENSVGDRSPDNFIVLMFSTARRVLYSYLGDTFHTMDDGALDTARSISDLTGVLGSSMTFDGDDTLLLASCLRAIAIAEQELIELYCIHQLEPGQIARIVEDDEQRVVPAVDAAIGSLCAVFSVVSSSTVQRSDILVMLTRIASDLGAPQLPRVDDNFILIDAGLPFLEAAELTEILEARYLIAEHRGEFYLFDHEQIAALRDSAEPAARTENVLGLPELAPTVTVDAKDVKIVTERPALVFEDDQPLGVLGPEAWGTTGGGGAGHSGGGGHEPSEPDPRPTLRAEIPARVPLGSTVLLHLSVGPCVNAAGLKPARSAPLFVRLRALDCLEYAGAEFIDIDVEPGGRALAPIPLRAAHRGVARIHVELYCAAVCSGSFTLHPEVVEQHEEGIVRRALPILEVIDSPDVSLLILRDAENLQYLIHGHGEQGYRNFGSTRLATDPFDLVADIRSELETSMDFAPADAEAQAERVGVDLYETLFPDDLREFLWTRRDRVTSISVISDEPWIPWELCRLARGGEEGPFFGEGFAITRNEPGVRARSPLPREQVRAVASDAANLPFVREEMEQLQRFAVRIGADYERIPAQYRCVLEALGKGTSGVFHFAGHGVAAGDDAARAPIILLDHDQPHLRPRHLSGRIRQGIEDARPLVFLNACQVGQDRLALTGIGGFARKFMRAGASGFVSTYWEIEDQLAFAFMKAFYLQLESGASLGRAAQFARQSLDATGATRLAYTVHGLPTASLDLPRLGAMAQQLA